MTDKAVIDEAWDIVTKRRGEFINALVARFGSMAVATFIADAASVGIEGAEPDD